MLKKDSATGGFADEWKAAFQGADIKEEDHVDLAPILSNAALSVKDEKELVGYTGSLYLALLSNDPLANHSRRLTSLKRPHDKLFRRRDV